MSPNGKLILHIKRGRALFSAAHYRLYAVMRQERPPCETYSWWSYTRAINEVARR